jgi:hypothetical protein
LSKECTLSYLTSLVVLISSVVWVVRRCDAEQTKRPFTVADDIGLTLFWTVGIARPKIQFSPDGNYFSVYSEHGRLDLNRIEASLRIYRSQDVEDSLKGSNDAPPQPIWVISRCAETAPIISDLRWLTDSSGLAFLEGPVDGIKRLVLADLRTQEMETLTSAMEGVKEFDIRDRRNYVYTLTDPAPLQKMQVERQAPAMVGTGRTAKELLFPDDPITVSTLSSRHYLWAVVSGQRSEVRKSDGAPIVLSERNVALSPGGRFLIAQEMVPEVPASWEILYPPALASSPLRIRVGRELTGNSVRQYVRVNLRTGSVQSLTDAPVSASAGWYSGLTAGPKWSSDGQAILLPGTFLHSKDHVPSRPCIAVVDLSSNTRTCVEPLRGQTETGFEEGYHFVSDVRFIDGDKHRVMVSFKTQPEGHAGNTEYRSKEDGTWEVVGQSKGESEVGHNGLEIEVEEAFDRAPVLVAGKKEMSRVIWDPNPRLNELDLGQASLYTWKDKQARDWRGLLFKPSHSKPGRRYPLVIQTHGFSESFFIPSGRYPTAYAARELAAADMVVLQVEEGACIYSGTPSEAPCGVSGYAAAAEQLVSEGVVDPERIGIIGFSRTCLHVMEALTTGALHLKAASITDGAMANYLQYMLGVDSWGNVNARNYDSVIGAKPFGDGLQQWLRRSPLFRLDKVTTPLLVVGEGPFSLLFMWEPYAGLRYLQKPVDLIMLNTSEHVLTNPAVRLASQGGTVDWFRFWLKDEEDPDPAKAEQYERWRELRKMQQREENKLAKP